MFGCFTFAKLGCFVKQTNNFFTTQTLGAVGADLLYKTMLGLCLIISRAASYIPSLCVYYDLYGFKGINTNAVVKQKISATSMPVDMIKLIHRKIYSDFKRSDDSFGYQNLFVTKRTFEN